MRKPFCLSRCLIAVVALTAFCLPCRAQGNLRTVLFVKLKLDQVDNWEAAAKDYAALVKKAGSEQAFTVWKSQTGPSEYAIVWYSAKWKDIRAENPKLKSSEADLAWIFSRMNGQTDRMERWIDEMQPDLTFGSKEIPLMVRTGRTRVLQGKMDELKALFHDQIVPAVKKSGATDYGVAVARFGTPANEIHSYIGMSGWGDLDSPFGAEKGMSAAEWKAFQAKLPSLIESTEWTVWTYQPDLSYLPPAK
jgi:hypothetical protein